MADKARRTVVVTGAAMGIGAATKAWLEANGHRVIGVDLKDADVIADLSSQAGRDELVDAVARVAPKGIDGVVAAAGISSLPGTTPRADLMVKVNYFGAIATIEGLRPMLAKSHFGRTVAVLSTAALTEPDQPLIDAMLAGDEETALRLAEPLGPMAYHQTKLALGLWVRRTAVLPEWAGAGLALNAVGPGQTRTRMTIPLLADPEMKKMLDGSTPYATGAIGEPEDLAEVIGTLATLDTGYVVGQAIFVDGGTDAIQRPAIL